MGWFKPKAEKTAIPPAIGTPVAAQCLCGA